MLFEAFLDLSLAKKPGLVNYVPCNTSETLSKPLVFLGFVAEAFFRPKGGSTCGGSLMRLSENSIFNP